MFHKLLHLFGICRRCKRADAGLEPRGHCGKCSCCK